MAVRLLFRNHSKRRRNDNAFQKWGQGRVIDIKNNITTTSIKGHEHPLNETLAVKACTGHHEILICDFWNKLSIMS